MNAAEYQRMFQVEDRHWWYVALHELVLALVAREAADKGRLAILDAGCGTGRLAQLLQPFGGVTGCDQAEAALHLARQRGVATVAADLNHADFGTAAYDVITCLDVLYHRAIHAEAPVLAALGRALRPGGLLVLQLPAYSWLRSTHDLAVHTRRRYLASDLPPWLAAAGLVPELISYRLGLLLPAIAGVRLAKRLFHREVPAATVSDVALPAPWLNQRLLQLLRAENRRILHGRTVPCGTSLFVTARQPAGGDG